MTEKETDRYVRKFRLFDGRRVKDDKISSKINWRWLLYRLNIYSTQYVFNTIHHTQYITNNTLHKTSHTIYRTQSPSHTVYHTQSP